MGHFGQRKGGKNLKTCKWLQYIISIDCHFIIQYPQLKVKMSTVLGNFYF